MSDHRRYLAWLAGALLVLALLPLANLAVMLRAGELTAIPEVARIQQKTGAIYGSGLHDTRAVLSLEIARQRKPEVLALGSSRPLELRQEYFTRPFSCACGPIDWIEDALPYVDELLRVARPRLVLFGLDFWWFTATEARRGTPVDLETAGQLTRAKILRPAQWVREGTISPADYARLLAGEHDLSRAIPLPKIGVMAIKRGLGVRADGSILHGERLLPEGFELYGPARAQMQDPTAFVMAQGGRRGARTRYGPDNVVVPERLAELDRVLAALKASGAYVIVYLPPVAPPVARAMAASGRHRFLQDLDRELRARGDEYFNFHDASRLSTDLCEYSDAHHAGNVVYMRLLRAMISARPGGPLARVVDRPRIEQAIERFRGSTIARFESDGALPAELDFLAAGCRREQRP